MEKRVGIYIRQRGKSIYDSEEFKTENFSSRDELYGKLVDFVDNAFNDLEDGEDYEDE